MQQPLAGQLVIAERIAGSMVRSGRIPVSWRHDAAGEGRAALLAREDYIRAHPNPPACAAVVARNAIIDFTRRMRFGRELPFTCIGISPDGIQV